MLLDMFNDVLRNIGLVALLVSFVLLTLHVSRDAFDAEQVEIQPPIDGPPVVKWEWRYMSAHADNCRVRTMHLIDKMQKMVGIILVAILLSFVINGAFDVLGWWGSTERVGSSLARTASNWWGNVVSLPHWLHFLVAGWVVIITPFAIFHLTNAVHELTMARASHRENKQG